MEKRNIYVVILAAGRSSRMASLSEEFSKVAYPILDKPLVNYVLSAAKPLNAENTLVVVGFGGNQTIKCVEKEAQVVWQKEVLGTGHAVMQAIPFLKDKDADVFILCGDTPLLRTETLEKIYHKHYKNGNDLTICSTILVNPEGYGRVVRDHTTHLVKEIRPYAELDEEEKEIREINSGIYVVKNSLLQEYLPKLSRENKKDEYYLSDILHLMERDGHKVDAYVLEDAQDIYNINDRTQLAYAAKIVKKRKNHELMMSGVSLEDPDTAYISTEAEIGQDTVILPNVMILGHCKIGSNNILGPNCLIKEANIGNNNRIINSQLEGVKIGDNQEIGPFVSMKGNK